MDWSVSTFLSHFESKILAEKSGLVMSTGKCKACQIVDLLWLVFIVMTAHPY